MKKSNWSKETREMEERFTIMKRVGSTKNTILKHSLNNLCILIQISLDYRKSTLDTIELLREGMDLCNLNPKMNGFNSSDWMIVQRVMFMELDDFERFWSNRLEIGQLDRPCLVSTFIRETYTFRKSFLGLYLRGVNRGIY